MIIKRADRLISIDERNSYAYSVSTSNQFIWKTTRQLIDEAAVTWPSKIAFTFPNESDLQINFSDLRQRVRLIAQNLLHAGFKRGDRLGIAAKCRHEVIIFLLASAYIGLVTVYLCSSFCKKKAEFEHLLKRSGCKGLLIASDSVLDNNNNNNSDTNCIDLLKSISPDLDDGKQVKGDLNLQYLPDLRHIIVLNSTKQHDACWSYNDLASRRLSNQTIDWPYIDPYDPSVITFTNDAKGMPKASVHKQFSFINNAHLLKHSMDVHSRYQLKMLFAFPKLHITLPLNVYMGLMNGVAIIFPFKDFKAAEAIASIKKHRPYVITGPPRMLDEILNAASDVDLSSVKKVFSDGNVVNFDSTKRVKLRWNDDRKFFSGYASSNPSNKPNLYWNLNDPKFVNDRILSSVGYFMPFIEVKVVDQETRQLAPLGEEGILHVRSPYTTIESYAKPDQQQQREISEGADNNWLDTGDLVCLNADGCLYFRGEIGESFNDLPSGRYSITSPLIDCTSLIGVIEII